MAQKMYDVVIKTGEYTAQDGSTKGRYENVGTMMQGDNGPFLLLKRTFNPAGVPNPDNRDTVLVSLFSDNNQQQNGYQQPAPQQQYQQPAQQYAPQQQAPQQGFQQPSR
jgi:hypothetical protein